MKKLIETLSKIFSNKSFINDLMPSNMEAYDSEIVQWRLAQLLEYYVITRDSKTDYSYEELQTKLELELCIMVEDCDDVIRKGIGILTHSFNGYKKDRIMKYGLDYMQKMSQEEKAKVIEMRQKLEKLEEILGYSEYVKEFRTENKSQRNPNEVFLCTPGTKTMHYACQRSPERFYLGPANQHGKPEPIVVGESKESYILRVLTKKIQAQYANRNSQEYLQIIKIAQDLAKYYCGSSPAIALIDIEKIQHIPTSNIRYEPENTMTLRERIDEGVGFTYYFFSRESNASEEMNNLGNIATLPSFIPQEAIVGIVDMLDEFELKQMFARAKGRKVGDLIDYNDCHYIGKPTIEQLMETISSSASEEDLDEIKNKYLRIKQQMLARKEELEEQKQQLLSSRQPLTEDEYTLEGLLKQFQQNGTMLELLEKDDSISSDELQYQSYLHGTEHTRRVNFLALTIMNLENITGRDREIVLEIVKNHDIGRVDDEEDKQHGENSVQKIEETERRLEGFSEEEQQLIKFVIQQHSRSTKENEQAVSEVPEELKQRYSMILNLFKDADKLDRVRLDPKGSYKEVGLDSSRLLLESSKKLESVAYEAYYNLIEILDIEQEIKQINMSAESFEAKMQTAQKERERKSRFVLESLIENSKGRVGLKSVKEFVRKVRASVEKLLNLKDSVR